RSRAWGSLFVERGHASHNRRGTTLHVIAAPAIDAITVESCFKRWDGHTDGGHRIEMSAEDERGAIAASYFGDHVRPSWSHFFKPASDSPKSKPIVSKCSDSRLAFALIRRQCRINRRNAD